MNQIEEQLTDAGNISAIWILSCNDPIPMMTYAYIKSRLGIEQKDAKLLIEKYKALFRTNIPENWVNEWKIQITEGWEVKHTPSGNLDEDNKLIEKVPTKLLIITDKIQFEKKLKSISSQNVFMSQFRMGINTPPSSYEILNWGLEHIERLRKSKIEVEDQRWKKTKEFWIPLASLLIAFLTIFASSIIQYKSIVAQREIKEYELSFKP